MLPSRLVAEQDSVSFDSEFSVYSTFGVTVILFWFCFAFFV